MTSGTEYRHRESQLCWIGIVLTMILVLFLAGEYACRWGSDPLPSALLPIISLSSLVFLLLFYRLETTVTDKEIVVRFGVGWIRKRIPLQHVRAVRLVKTPFWGGAGIRIGSDAVLWNAAFTGAVELTLRNSRICFRIGSKNPQRLQKIIEKQLSK